MGVCVSISTLIAANMVAPSPAMDTSKMGILARVRRLTTCKRAAGAVGHRWSATRESNPVCKAWKAGESHDAAH